jgi:two-component system chemotaxis response regulator CheB
MGRDGADGLKRLREAGAQTFAQDEASSVVYGMPRAARENGGAKSEFPLSAIAAQLARFA